MNTNSDLTEAAKLNGTINDFWNAQNTWLDNHLTAVNSRTTKPRWIIVYTHYSPFSIVRTPNIQNLIQILEKHKVPLLMAGHHHSYSRSKAIYCGYGNSQPYNDYVTKVSGSTDLKIVTEYKADGSTLINRTEDLKNGTHYVMLQSSGLINSPYIKKFI